MHLRTAPEHERQLYMQHTRSISVFLAALTPVSCWCLVFAGVALGAAIYSWLPLQEHSDAVLVPMVLGTIATMGGAFVTMARHHWSALPKGRAPPTPIAFPTAYWVAAVLALVYCLFVSIGSIAYDPHGIDLGPAANLRIFSAVSLLQNLAALGFAQWAGLRLKSYEAAAADGSAGHDA